MMLPWLVLGLTNLTDYARFTRGQMVETFERGLHAHRTGQRVCRCVADCSSTPCVPRSCR